MTEWTKRDPDDDTAVIGACASGPMTSRMFGRMLKEVVGPGLKAGFEAVHDKRREETERYFIQGDR